MDTKLAEEIAVGDVFKYSDAVVKCVGEQRPSQNRFGSPWFKYRACILAGKRKGNQGDVVFGPGATVELVRWILEDTEGLRHCDEIGGDAAGLSWSARWFHCDGHAAVTRHWYVVPAEELYGTPDPEGLEYTVCSAIEWETFTDISDPGGTETWSDTAYDRHPDLAHATVAEADAVARDRAEYDRLTFAVDYPWDGEASG